MENPKYIVIETKKKDTKDTRISRIWFFHKWYREYLYHKLPLSYEQLEYLQIPGKRIILPFTMEELQGFKKEKITDMLNRIIMEEGTQNIVVERSLDCYVDPAIFIDGYMIPFLYLDDIIRLVRKIHKIPEKSMKLKIIDNSTIDLEGMITTFLDNLNFLTIITDREEELLPLAEKIYDETGLMVRIVNKRCLQEPAEDAGFQKADRDVILDLSEGNIENIYCLEKEAVYIDLSFNKEKAKTMLTKRKDIIYYNYFEFMMENQKSDNRLLQAVLCGNATWISKWDVKEMAAEAKKYPIQLIRAGVSLNF